MRRYLVIINGLGGTGKSEFIKQCAMVAQYFEEKTGVSECSTVDYVKEVAESCGWSGEKEAKDRVFLSDLKQALEKWDNVPYKKTIEKINTVWNYMEDEGYLHGVVFVNSREENDINNFYNDASLYEAKPIKLYISNNRIEVNEVPELIEGIESFKTQCDYHIENNGTLFQLFMSATYFMQDLLGVELKNEEK